MSIVYIVRHAWAEEADSERFPNDDLRPLTVEGKQRFAKLVKKLRKRGFAPTIIASSPLVRCRETSEILADVLKLEDAVIPLDELAPGADAAALVEWSSRQRHDAIALVGHAPDVGFLTSALIGDDRTRIQFAKGAVAAIEFDGLPAIGAGELVWHVTAKILGV